MLVRDGADGPEVFMLQRTHGAAFAKSQYVFPGGKVDAEDHSEDFEPICDGLDDVTASRLLGLDHDHGGLAWLVAAIRECFEEAGVLLARRADSDSIISFDDPDVADRFNDYRRRVDTGSITLDEVCRREGLNLLVDRMHLVDHWVTPVGERRRFDTRFFVTRAPEAQEPLHDDGETIASRWVRPADALRLWREGELQMFPPTAASLRFLADHATATAAIEAARAIGVPPRVLPKLVVDDGGRITGVIRPGEAGYDDAAEPEYVLGGPR